jgi:hypothetical protein
MEGWKIVASNASEVFLERRRGFSFCANMFLCLATAFLWLAYWIPRALHPRIEQRIMTISPAGEIQTTAANWA